MKTKVSKKMIIVVAFVNYFDQDFASCSTFRNY